MIKNLLVNESNVCKPPLTLIRFSSAYSSGTECRIYPKPGCKFEFVRCLKVYEKKLTNLDPEGTLEGPFLPMVP